MNRFFQVIIVLFGLLAPQLAFAEISADARKDMYLNELAPYLKNKDYLQAAPLFDKLLGLGVNLPKALLYFEGETFANLKQYKRAERALIRYIETMGNKGAHYKDALHLLAHAEKVIGIEKKRKEQKEAQRRKIQHIQAVKNARNQIVVDGISAQMVSIPSSTFSMGDEQLFPHEGSDELPTHRVSIKAFKMSRYEITQQQWKAVMGSNPSTFKKVNNPVEMISWNDIKTFIHKLNSKTGKHFRLPTEAEWEYAARGYVEDRRDLPFRTTNEAFPWGAEADHDYANYGKDRCCEGDMSGRDKWKNTSPVGSFQANSYGLFDMQGNVWEWVQDCYHDSYNGAPNNGQAWLSDDCSQRVLRGGSWHDSPDSMRPANRYKSAPGRHGFNAGFRLAQNITEKVNSKAEAGKQTDIKYH